MPTWPPILAQNRPQIGPRAPQDASIIASDFCIAFFDKFLFDFGMIFDFQIDPKSNKHKSKKRPNSTTTKQYKCKKPLCFYKTILPSAMLWYARKSLKMVPRSLQKQILHQDPHSDQFWCQLGPLFGKVLGAKMGPSWHQIALKINLPCDYKNDHMADCSWYRFLPIWGPILEPT